MVARGLLVWGVVGLLVLLAIDFGVSMARSGVWIATGSGAYLQFGSRADYAGSAVDRSPLQADLDLLWRNRPGTELTQPVAPAPFGRHPRWSARINSEGFRGPERPRERLDEEVYRIVCVGDAVTYGFNVAENATYSAKLARLLERRYRPRRFEVVNAGVAGWSWAQGAAFLLRDGLALRPDLLVFGHGTDDQLWPADVTDSERMWLLTDALVRRWAGLDLAAQESLIYRVAGRWLGGSSGVVSSSPGCRQQTAESGVCRRVPLPEIEATVHRVAEIAKAAGVGLVVLNLDFLGTPAVEAVRRATRRDGIPFRDFAEDLRLERLRRQIARAWKLGLGPPQVPLVPTGMPLVGRGARMRFRVQRAAGGAELRIRGTGHPDTGFSVDEKLFDDGTHGDEVAGDDVFSVVVEMPPSVATLRYRFALDGIPEFRDPPAARATLGDRVLRFNRDGDAPIESLGVRYGMSDEMHPDARGHAYVAARLLREIERIPSFRRFAGLPMDAPEDVVGR